MNAQFLSPAGRDFVPRRILHFTEFAINYRTVAIANAVALGTTADSMTASLAPVAAFATLQENFPAFPTPAEREARRVAMASAVSAIRDTVRRYFRTPGIDSTILVSAGIPPIDSVRTAQTVVNNQVEVTFRPSLPSTITIHFFDPETPDSAARPLGMVGAKFVYFVGEAPPSRVEDYTHGSFFATAHLHRLDMQDLPRGARVWFRAAWVNRRGIEGTYSPPVDSYVA